MLDLRRMPANLIRRAGTGILADQRIWSFDVDAGALVGKQNGAGGSRHPPRVVVDLDAQGIGYSLLICPTIFDGSAPGIGVNFWSRPAKQSAR